MPSMNEPINDPLRTYRTAGYSDTEKFKVLKVQNAGRCGDIADGVVFQHDNDGAWVLDFKDLEDIYLLAKEARRL